MTSEGPRKAWPATALASCGYLSYLPYLLFKDKKFTGAGLVGTLCGVLAFPALPKDPLAQALAWLGMFFVSVVASDIAEVAMGRHDDPRIVIDEFIGVWAALLFLPATLPVLIAAFVLFRILDVLKPGPIRKAAKLPGGWGVVMDDVLAGVAVNLVLHGLVFAKVL
jgi:phosphatidylglycerophosphatase A